MKSTVKAMRAAVFEADIAAAKAREWLDREGVDVLMSGASSAADLAIAKVANEKKKPRAPSFVDR